GSPDRVAVLVLLAGVDTAADADPAGLVTLALYVEGGHYATSSFSVFGSAKLKPWSASIRRAISKVLLPMLRIARQSSSVSSARSATVSSPALTSGDSSRP